MFAAAQNPQSGVPASQVDETTPPPAFGQTAPILNPDNPPLSGLDEPSLRLRTANRSFISPEIQVGESIDSNAQNSLKNARGEGVSHLLGALDLQKFWPRSDLFLEYLGGAAFGDSPYYVRQLQAVGLQAVTRWRTGQFTLRDGLDYLPDGSFFAASAGGLPGFGIATGAIGLGLPGVARLNGSSVGTIPRLSNTAAAQATQALTPRSAVTFVGAFGSQHFYNNSDNLVDGDSTTVEGGYSHLVSRHDQVALIYAFQIFQFPLKEGGEIYNNVMNVRYSHVINGKMSFVGSVGPQYTDVHYGGGHTEWSPTGRAIFRYRFSHASLTASYEKFRALGSGFFAGADSQVAEVAFRRPLGRTFEISTEGGFSYNTRLQSSNFGAVGATSYKDGFIGTVLRKHLGRTWDAIAAYRFSELQFNAPVTLGGEKGRTNQRQVGTVALEWHPRAIRLE